MLVAQIDASDHTQKEIASSTGIGEARLSELLRRGDLLEPGNFELLGKIESVLGTRVVSRFAERVRHPATAEHRDILADEKWWSDLRSTTFDSPVSVVMAGHALLAARGQHEPDAIAQLSERTSRRHLAFGLCRVASGPFGHALEAMTLLARLAPELGDEMCYFMKHSPLGGWVARAADRALRLYPDDQDLYYKIATTSREMVIDPLDPARLIYPLLLRRRVVLHGRHHSESQIPRDLIRHFTEIALSSTFPSRWRRFSLWILAEFLHQPLPGNGQHLVDLASFKTLVEECATDRDLSDITSVFENGPAGPVETWELPQDDLYRFDTRDMAGHFSWHLDAQTDQWMALHLDRLLNGRSRPSRWRQAGSSRLMIRLHDSLRELISHPGFVRVQSAVEMLLTAGPAIVAPTSQTLTEMAESVIYQPDVSPGPVDNVIYAIGALRAGWRSPSTRYDPAPWLSAHGLKFPLAEHRASAMWSIGDTWTGRTAPRDMSSTLERAMNDESPMVRRAALHTCASLEPSGLERLVTGAADDGDPRTSRFARWCMLVWDARSLSMPPVDFTS
ncbi:MAG: hypothetical protein S0880_10725 [Actinomycetota bacterium]|nr:hypothetical protein [Actinomycetota bacterium]